MCWSWAAKTGPIYINCTRGARRLWLPTSAGDDQVLLVTRDALLRWSRRPS